MSIAGRRRGARICASGLLVATFVVAVSIPSHGTEDDPSSQEEIASSLSLDLSRLNPGVLRVADPLSIGTTVTNSGIAEVPNLSISVAITTDPIEDRTLLDSWASGDLALATREVARAPVGGRLAILPATSVGTGVSVQPGVLNFPLETSGVYGMTVTLENPEGALKTIYTFVTWLDTEPQAFPVSVIILASGSSERVDALIDTVDRPEIAYAVDPTDLSQTAVTRLSAFDTFLLPANNVDLTSFAHAGYAHLLDRALKDARSIAPTSFVSSPWLAVVPDPDQVSLDLATEHGARAILSVPAYSPWAPVLTGYEGGVPPGVAVSAVPETTGPLVLLPDPQLSTAFVAGPPDSVTTPARLTAETALLASDNTAGNPILIVGGPRWAIESDHQSGTLAALIDSPWVYLTPISTVLEYDSPALITLPTLVPSSTDIPEALLASTDASLRGIEALAAATSDPSEFSDSLVSSLLGTLSVDRRADLESRNAAIQAAVTAIDDVRALVFLPGSSPLNLISTSGNFPVTVTNDLEVEVTIKVILKSRSPILRIEDQPQMILAPGASEQVLVPVTAISSGTVAVRVSLENLDGDRLTSVSEFSLRINAQWGDVFTLALASFALLLLVAGSWRTIRRGRADTRQGPSAVPDDGEAT